MDPFAAIGLAGNIITFIEFAVKLISRTSEVYQSATGETEAQSTLRYITNDLGKISSSLSAPLSDSCSRAEKDLAELATDCKREGEELLNIIKSLNTPVRGKLPSAKVVLKTFFKRRDIAERSERLAQFRSALILRLTTLTNDQNSSISKLLWNLTEASSTMSASTSSRLDKLQATVEQLRESVSKASRNTSNIGDEDMTGVASKMDTIRQLGDPLAREQQILKSLCYDSMRMRHSAVVKAHDMTYEWMFSQGSKFRKWLSHGDEIFWVSGKPGSGKSTLMKFLYHHHFTTTLLESWAKCHKLVKGSFFFWSSGTEMEKSLQGLFQSLVFEMMRQCPSIISILCPNRWSNAFESSAHDPWTWDEIKTSFDKASEQRNMSTKFCFFIDGLDEYGGEHSEMLKLLIKASKSENMKMCLASRPDNIFQSAFGHLRDRMLRLQDLTRDDIRLYAKDKLNSHQSLLRLQSTEKQYEPLINDIVEKADGVFLWVTLVVRSLSEGITNADTVPTLQKRLQQLPSDLERFFTHILNSVDEIYWEGTAQAFQMAMTSVHSLPLWVFAVLDEPDTNMALRAEIETTTRDQYIQKTEILSKRLNARCKGLLEVRLTESQDYPGLHRVEFLHRTARDFLRVKSVEKLLLDRQKAHFDPDRALCEGFLLQMKQLHLSTEKGQRPDDHMLHTALLDLMHYAYRLEKRGLGPPEDLLDECLEAVTKVSPKSPTMGVISFFPYVVRQGLSQYLQLKLSTDVNILHCIGGQPLLSIALTSRTPQILGSRYYYELDPSVIELLLRYRAAPNQPYFRPLQKNSTVWMGFLQFILKDPPGVDPGAKLQTTRLMLDAGADPNITVNEKSLKSIVGTCFSPSEIKLLTKMIVDLQAGRHSESFHTNIELKEN